MIRFVFLSSLFLLVSGSAKSIEECSTSELVWSKENQLSLLGPREASKEGYFNSPGTTSYMHVSVAGVVNLEYELSESGSVENIKVLDADYYLIGPDKNSYPQGHFDGYLEKSVVGSIKKWKYKPLKRRCKRSQKFKIEYQ